MGREIIHWHLNATTSLQEFEDRIRMILQLQQSATAKLPEVCNGLKHRAHFSCTGLDGNSLSTDAVWYLKLHEALHKRVVVECIGVVEIIVCGRMRALQLCWHKCDESVTRTKYIIRWCIHCLYTVIESRCRGSLLRRAVDEIRALILEKQLEGSLMQCS